MTPYKKAIIIEEQPQHFSVKREAGNMDVNGHAESARIVAAASFATIWGLTFNEWTAIATFVYMVLQIFVLSPKAFSIIKQWFKK